VRTSLNAALTALVLVLATIVLAPAAPAEGSPWIQSDQADYPPGATVTLSAGGFVAAEAVHVSVNDDQGRTWTYDADVVADDAGAFATSFTLPSWFVATYAVTATAPSGTATTSFTDGNVVVTTSTAAKITFTQFKDQGCAGAVVNNYPKDYIVGTPELSSQTDGVPNNGSLLLEAAANAVGGAAWASWTVSGTPIVSGAGTRIICVNSPSGSASALATYTPPANSAPVAVNDNHSTNEDTQLVVAAPGVLGNDSDPDSNPLTTVLVTGPAHGFLELGVNGGFSYTPTANYAGPDSFTYNANDGSLDSDVATVALTVTAVNDAPVAADDSYSVDEDGTLAPAAAAGVLANDTDIDSAALTAAKVSNPAHGTVTVNTNGSFTYTPVADYTGPDSFTYKVNDGSLDSNVATVTLTVTAVNDAPVAADDSYSVDEDGTLAPAAAVGVLANDTDAEGDSLTVALVDGPEHGTLTLNPNGSFTYVADGDFHGSDSFTYRANDGSANSNPATVSLTVNPVNDDPVAHDDDAATDEDTPVVIDVLANDSDPADGDTVSLSSATDGDHGSVVVNLDGTVTYTPVADYNGPDTFTYMVGDGHGGSDMASVSITVNPVNDAPVAADDSYSVDEDGVLAPGATSGALTNDTDVDGDSLTVALVGGPTHGTLALNPDGSFTYSPDANFHGSDSFTYRASDGSLDSNPATVSLTVDPVNDNPVAGDDNAATDEDTPVVIDVLVNDSDPADGDPVSVSSATNGDHGTVVVNLDGTVTYTPAANYNGPDTFTYTVGDGHGGSDTASVSITVNPVNDAPVATGDSYSVDEDQLLTKSAAAGVLINDSDVDGDVLSAVLVSGPSHGTVTLNANGSFDYTPAANFNGADSFTYKVSDGPLFSNVATVSITVNAVNDAPVADDDTATTAEDTAATIEVLPDDSDVDGDSLTVTSATDPDHGSTTVNADGTVSYTPDADYFGLDSFTYTVGDGNGGSDTATVTVTVSPVNDAPVADDETATTAEDSAVTIDVLAGDTDVDGDSLDVDSFTDPAHGSVVENGDGTLSYTPDANYYGPDSFEYEACDNAATTPVPDDQACDDGDVSITVTAVNDAPVALGDSASTLEDQPVNGNVAGNDSDVDLGDQLTWSLAVGGQAADGTATVDADGSFSYTPNADFYGFDAFTYRACDNDSTTDAPVTPACETATVSITVNPVNDAPVADDHEAATAEDTAVDVVVLAGATDVDGDSLTVTDLTDPAHGSVVENADGTVTYTPDADYNGPDSFTYTVCDDHATTPVPEDQACDDGDVSITVTPVNDAPVVTPGAAQAIDEGAAATITATVTDIDGDTSFTALVDWGDGSSTSESVTGGALSATHTYVDDQPAGDDVYQVVITVTDDGTTNGLSDPLSGTAGLNVNVSNVAPAVAAPTVSVNAVTGLVSLLTTFTDPAGTHDSYTGSFSVNGSSMAGSVSGTSMSGSKTLAPGCYAIDATGSVTDNDGGTGSSATTHTSGVDVYVSSFLSPIRDDTRNLAKYGNVVPIKVSLASQCTPGTTVTNVPLFLTLVQGDATLDDSVNDSTTPVVESVSSADSGTAMRVADGKYIYNLTTKQFTVAKDYTIRVRVGSATGPIILRALIQAKK